MSFEDEKSRLYFLRYAFTSLEKKHSLNEDYRAKILNGIRNNEADSGLEEAFLTGILGCLAFSKKMCKERINEEAIRKYFHSPLHNNYSECKASEGVVVSLNGKEANIQTSVGQAEYKIFLEPGLEVGDRVGVHGNYVIEVIK
jgi:hypothetical protein